MNRCFLLKHTAASVGARHPLKDTRACSLPSRVQSNVKYFLFSLDCKALRERLSLAKLVHDGRPVNVCESKHHKSLDFRGEKADEALSHGWHVNYSSLPTPNILYVATCHKHHQPTTISDILNLGLNTFFSTGQTHDWCAVHPSSSPGARITLDLNNSSNLFVIFITLTLRLGSLLNWKNLCCQPLVSSSASLWHAASCDYN